MSIWMCAEKHLDAMMEMTIRPQVIVEMSCVGHSDG